MKVRTILQQNEVGDAVNTNRNMIRDSSQQLSGGNYATTHGTQSILAAKNRAMGACTVMRDSEFDRSRESDDVLYKMQAFESKQKRAADKKLAKQKMMQQSAQSLTSKVDEKKLIK